MNNIHIGFHKSDVTPKTGGIPLSGWGATHLRLAATVEDPLYCSVTAVGNGEKAEYIIINLDLISIPTDKVKRLRTAIFEKTGYSEDRVIISGTHTHSAPDLSSKLDTIETYIKFLEQEIPDCIKRAVADMKPATIYYGKNEVGRRDMRINFVRHYTMTDIEYKDNPSDGPVYYSGNNFGFEYLQNPDKYIYTGHESEADPEVQLIEFRRENADSILLVNFQSHALLSSGIASTVMTSDFPGAVCEELKKRIGNCEAVYIQGCCGNINPFTRIREEALLGICYDPFRANDDCDCDWRAYGKIIAAYAKEIHDTKLTKSKSNEFRFARKILNLPCDHSRDDKLPEIEWVLEKYDKEGNTRETIEAAMSAGLVSPYEATAIRTRSKLPLSMDFEINALRFGDTAMTTVPAEHFDQTGKYIKANSPFKLTLNQCYSCGRYAYLPAEGTCMTGYERNNTFFAPGTAEIIRDAQLDLLNTLK
ncbi:MAG: hypothetical protein IJJ40_00160 [Clostridia bacterium]|nr:hypothetical protein [Clostridia bacterium]